MSHYGQLRTRLKDTPYLVADVKTKEVKLVDKTTAFELMCESGPFPTQAIVNAKGDGRKTVMDRDFE